MKIKSDKLSADIITAELKLMYEPVMCLHVYICLLRTCVFTFTSLIPLSWLSLMFARVVLDGNGRPSLPPSLPVNGGIINASPPANYARGVI